MNNMHYIGLDVHKKTIAFCIKLVDGHPHRFAKNKQAISYCGLCSAENKSAGKSSRGPISRKRNKHLQHRIIEAAKIAPIWNEQLVIQPHWMWPENWFPICWQWTNQAVHLNTEA